MVPAPLEADRLIGDRYVLEAFIGRGGMGEVWRARHKALRSPAAIKFLSAGWAASESSRRRFLNEARVTASLKTKHAVQVFDFGVTDDGLPYLVMELLEGETLARRIAREGRLSIALTSLVMRQSARALDRAHALGIVHRDFKPENVILLADEEGGEQVKVVDFGIAKLASDLDPGSAARDSTADDPRTPRPQITLQANSNSMGTPYYMAPEQIEDAAKVGRAADIWALGVVAFECLTGERPFEGASVIELLRSVIEGADPIPASARAPVPKPFDDWFRVACARDPAARFADAQAAASALLVALGQAQSDANPSGAAGFGAEAGPDSGPSSRGSRQHQLSPMAATVDVAGPRSSALTPRVSILANSDPPADSQPDPPRTIAAVADATLRLAPEPSVTDAPRSLSARASRGARWKGAILVIFVLAAAFLTVRLRATAVPTAAPAASIDPTPAAPPSAEARPPEPAPEPVAPASVAPAPASAAPTSDATSAKSADPPRNRPSAPPRARPPGKPTPPPFVLPPLGL